MRQQTNGAVRNSEQVPAGKVMSCSYQWVIRFRFRRRPSPTALAAFEDWLEEQRPAVTNFKWLEDGWLMRVYTQPGRTDWLAETSADMQNYLKRNGFMAA